MKAQLKELLHGQRPKPQVIDGVLLTSRAYLACSCRTIFPYWDRGNQLDMIRNRFISTAEVVEHVFWLGSRRSLDLGYHNHNTSNLYLRSPAQCQGDLCGTNERHVARSLLEVIGGRGEGRKEGPDSRCQAAESNTWWHGARRKASVLVKLRSSRRCVSVKLGLSSRSLGSIVSRPRLSP